MIRMQEAYIHGYWDEFIGFAGGFLMQPSDKSLSEGSDDWDYPCQKNLCAGLK